MRSNSETSGTVEVIEKTRWRPAQVGSLNLHELTSNVVHRLECNYLILIALFINDGDCFAKQTKLVDNSLR